MSAKTFSQLVEKDFTASGVHVTTAIGNEGSKGKKKPASRRFSDFVRELNKRGMDDGEPPRWNIPLEITKTDDELRVVYGWASMAMDGGNHIVDVQGDKIDVPDLVKAAHDYVTCSREAGDLHKTFGIGKVVESIVFTPDVQKSLGIDLGKTGWFIGMKIEDDSVWKRVKSGELRAFSIGGSAERVPDTGE